MNHNIYLYILVSGAVSFAVRVMPLTLIRRKIENRFIKSFLYYVPYVTLAVMTFPAIIEATQSQIAGIIALAVGIAAAWFGANMFSVAIISCAVVFIFENLMPLLLDFIYSSGI